VAVRKARLDDEILSFGIAQLPEALYERLALSVVPAEAAL
jgi:hypothetical protein